MKKEYILLIAVIIALSAYLVLRKTDKVAYELPQIEKIDQKNITEIEIQKQSETLKLQKTGGDWKIGDKSYIADKNRIDKLIKAVSSLEMTAMVSESKNYERFDLSHEKKIHVQIQTDKGTFLGFDIGKTAGTHRHTFVKLDDDDRVYQVRGDFRNNFDVTPEVLRDKQILAVDKNEIQQIRLNNRDQDLLLSRHVIASDAAADGSGEENKEDKAASSGDRIRWKPQNGEDVDAEQIDDLLGQLSDLRCNRFIYDQTVQDLGDPIYTVTLLGMDPENQKYTLAVFEKGSEEKNEYPVSSSGIEDPFILPKWQVEKIMVNLDKLTKIPEEKEKQ